MKFVTNVNPEKFDAFALQCPLNHYRKMSNIRAFMEPEYYAGDLLGVEDDNGNLLGTAVMMHKKVKFPFVQYSYCPYGFNVNDMDDVELIEYFCLALKNYAKEKGSIFLRMDPNITRLEHEKSGKIKEGGYNHEFLTALFEKCGYTHLGYNYGYGGNWLNRYTYILDLSQDMKTIKKGIKRCSQYTTKNEQRGVEVRKGTKEELYILADAQQQLSEKMGFKPLKPSYWEHLWDAYEGDVYYYIVHVNFHSAKLKLQKLIEDETAHLSIMKDERKMEPIRKNIEAMKKEIQQIEEEGYDKDEDINLGAKFIIKCGNRNWNVNMYTTKTLLNFREAFALHMTAIQEMKELGVVSYDFEGISGSLDPKDEFYGMYDFKKSFGGDFVEYLGEFDAILNATQYKIWKKSNWFKSGVRRKLRYYLHHKKK